MDDSVATLTAALARFYQGRGLHDGCISDLTSIADGWENEVYKFSLHRDSTAPETLILRLFPGDDAVEKSAREFEGMRMLYKLHYPVPRMEYHSADRNVLSKPFIIMQYIDGRAMGEIGRNAPADRQAALIERFCRLQARMHALDWRPFAPELSADDRFFYVDGLLSAGKGMIAYTGLDDFAPVLHWVAARRDQIPCRQPAVTHGDFHFFNVLVTPDEHDVVIDWTNIAVGDARADLAWTLLLSSTYGEPDMHDRLLDVYEHAAGREVEGLPVFMVIAAARRLMSIAASLGAGAERMGMRAEAVEQMKGSCDHIAAVYAVLVSRCGVHVPSVDKLLDGLA